MSSTVETATEIRPFHFEIPEDKIDDLRRRIAATRWPSKELVDDRSQGVQLATMQALARYWAEDYDFGKLEARLNELPQFTTEIDGVEIHFIHVKSEHEDALPLIMTHGWPGSVIELLETIGPLTDPTAHGGDAEDAFHLVLPSVPGYGFSGEPTEIGWDPGRTAQAWAELMHRLGYTRYVAQGGDVGAVHHRRDGPPGTRGAGRDPHEPARDGAWPPPGRPKPTMNARRPTRSPRSRRRASVTSWSRPRGRRRSATPCWTHPWPSRPGCSTTTRTATYKISGAFVDGKPTGNLTRDHILDNITRVLADAHRRFGGPVVLGERTSPGSRGRSGSSAGLAPGRLHGLPRRDLCGPPQLGRDRVPQPHLLQRRRQGRPLRGLGGAGALLDRGAIRVQVASLKGVVIEVGAVRR